MDDTGDFGWWGYTAGWITSSGFGITVEFWRSQVMVCFPTSEVHRLTRLFSSSVLMNCYEGLSSVMIFFMRCVHYAMFAAVPFVNCTNHVVKTFIRRNPKSYPITMHTVVVTPSAMYCLM